MKPLREFETIMQPKIDKVISCFDDLNLEKFMMNLCSVLFYNYKLLTLLHSENVDAQLELQSLIANGLFSLLVMSISS